MFSSQNSLRPRISSFKKAPRQGLSLLAFSVALALSGKVMGQEITSTTTGTPTTIALSADSTTQIFSNTSGAFGAVTLGATAIVLTVNNAAGSIDIDQTTTLRISDPDSTTSTLTVSANTSTSGAAINVADSAILNLALGIEPNGTTDSTNAVNLVIADDIVTTATSSFINFTTSNSGTDAITFSGTSIDLGDGADGSTNSRLTLSASNDSVTFSGTASQTLTGDIDGGAVGEGAVIVNNTASGTGGVTFNDEVGRGGGTALNTVTLTDGAVRFGSDVWTQNLTIATAAPVTLGPGMSANTTNGGGNLNLVNTGAINVGTGTIDGEAANDGALNVVGGTGNTVTFGGVIGGTNALGWVNIGDTSNNGFTNTAAANRSGAAVFNANVTAGLGLNVVGGDAADGSEDSSAVFNANVVVSSNELQLSETAGSTSGVNNATVTFSGTAAQTVNGDIDGEAAGEGEVIVNNTASGTGGVTFNDEVGTGGTSALRQVTLTDGAVRFGSDVWTQNLTIATAAPVTLGPGMSANTTNGGGNLNLVNTGAINVGTGTIDGVSANDGALNVVGGTGNTVTFGGAIGGTNALGWVNIGDTSNNGFTNTAAANRSGAAVFNANVTAGLGLNVVGGDAADGSEDSSAVFNANVVVSSNELQLSETAGSTSGVNNATVTFSGTAAQTVNGDIDGEAAGEGEVIVNNTASGTGGVTFNDEVGTGGTSALRQVTLTDGAVRFGSDVWTQNLTIATAAPVTLGPGMSANTTNGGGNLNLVNTGAINVGTGTIDGVSANDGALNVVGGTGNTVTFGGAIGGTNALGWVNIGDTSNNGFTNTAAANRSGAAVFNANVTAGLGLNVVGGDAADGSEDSSAVFHANVVVSSNELQLSETAGTSGVNNATVTFSGTAAQTVSGDIDGEAVGEGEVIVNNTLGSGVAVTFNDEVGTGGTTALRQVTLTDGAVRFGSDVWTQNLTIATAAPVTLGPGMSANTTNGGGNLNLVNTGAINVGTGTIDGVSANDGALNVVGGTGNTVTFGGAIGGTNALGWVNIGDTSNNGFTNTAAANRSGAAVFNANVTAGLGLNVVGGDAADGSEDSSAVFNANVVVSSNELQLSETSGTSGVNTATVTFSGTAAQTVSGDIDGEAVGEGEVIVNNTASGTGGVTFNDEVGTGGTTALRQVTLTDGAVRFGSDVWTQNLTIATAAPVTLGPGMSANTTNGGGNLNLVNTGAINVGTGTIDGVSANDGALNVVGGTGNTVTFGGAIGGTNALGWVNIGDTSNNGFTNTAAANRSGAAVFSANVTAGLGLNVVGGDAADGSEDSSAVFHANVVVSSNELQLSETEGSTSGVNNATVTFSGTGVQTVSGDIDGEAVGEGEVIVNNTASGTGGVTFNDEVGTGGTTALRQVTLTDGAVRFNDDVWTQNLTINPNAPVTLSGSTGDINLVNTGVINTGTGTIDGVGANEGIVNVLGGSNLVIFGGVLGGTNMLSQINVGDPAGAGSTRGGTAVFMADVSATNITVTSHSGATSSVVFGGNVTTATNTLTLSGNSGITFGGSEAQTVTGNIAAAGQNQGNVAVSNTSGTVTFNGSLGAAGTELNSLTLNPNTSTVLDSTVNVNTLTLTGPNSIRVGGDASRSGQTVISAATVVGSGTIMININDGVLGENQSLTLISATGGTFDATYMVNNNTLFNFQPSENGSTLSISAQRRPPCDVAVELGITLDTSIGLMNADIALDDGSSAQMALNTVLNTGGAAARQAANQVALQTDALAALGEISVGTSAQLVAVTSARLASLRAGEQYAGLSVRKNQGFASGDLPSGESLWLKPFAGLVNQSPRNNGREGYDAQRWGLAGGLETPINKEMNVGLTVAYAKSDVDGGGAGSVRVDTDSYQAMVYGGMTREHYYIEWNAGYTRNQHDMERSLSFGGLTNRAQASFNSNQFNLGIEAGRPMSWESDGAYWTPTVGLSVTHVIPESYTETGAGELNQSVSLETVTALVGTVGMKFHRPRLTEGGGLLVPFVEAQLKADFLGDELSATGQFAGGGAPFRAYGTKVEPLGVSFGLGVNYDRDQWSFRTSYDMDWRPGRVGVGVSLEAMMKF